MTVVASSSTHRAEWHRLGSQLSDAADTLRSRICTGCNPERALDRIEALDRVHAQWASIRHESHESACATLRGWIVARMSHPSVPRGEREAYESVLAQMPEKLDTGRNRQ